MNERAQWVRYPTPVLDGKPFGSDHLWIKNDGVSGLPYGGNKARKLSRILVQADASGAERLVTAGGAGSHHVLATTVYGKMRGYHVAAYLWPQQWTPHAEATLEASLSQGLEPLPVASAAIAVARLAFARSKHDYRISVGGFGIAAALAYAQAVRELADDVAHGVMPELDEIVVAVGTGSTAAGILAGLVHENLNGTVVGVKVARNPLSLPMVLALAARVLAALGSAGRIGSLAGRLSLDGSKVGRGYGHPSEEGERATEVARAAGLTLDPTYTAKAFARALASAGVGGFSQYPSGRRSDRPLATLYWHTLSAHPLSPLVKPIGGSERLHGLSRSLLRSRPTSPLDATR
jgi:1-aminocyclopropane-1-carboxylate deaminase/D-cysteine desulfhydrase-like pyridoxal-dependent ACC family enzyme